MVLGQERIQLSILHIRLEMIRSPSFPRRLVYNIATLLNRYRYRSDVPAPVSSRHHDVPIIGLPIPVTLEILVEIHMCYFGKQVAKEQCEAYSIFVVQSWKRGMRRQLLQSKAIKV